jgi:hypothetical protein
VQLPTNTPVKGFGEHSAAITIGDKPSREKTPKKKSSLTLKGSFLHFFGDLKDYVY